MNINDVLNKVSREDEEIVQPERYIGQQYTGNEEVDGTPYSYYAEPIDVDAEVFRAIDKLDAFIGMNNVALGMDAQELDTIGSRVVDEYEIDKKSRAQWEKDNETWIKLAKLTAEKKSDPWENSSNIKYPLIVQSAIQFAARAYPDLIGNRNVVKGIVVGKDPEGKKAARAKRISEHMSYQFTNQMEYWEEETDNLLTNLAFVGLNYRKTYRNKTQNRNESVFLTAEDVVVNYWAPNIDRVSRVTQKYELYPHEIEEMKRAGAFLDIELGAPEVDEKHDANDTENSHTFIEQHRWLDLDNDGYQEPYIVTCHLQTKKVVRITTRFSINDVKSDEDGNIIKIIPVQYFTKFSFLPNLDGSFYTMGFGALLGAITASINTTVNQIIDAGTLANYGGGWVDSKVGLKTGVQKRKMGEYVVVRNQLDDMNKGFHDIPVNLPSQVLYQVLSFLIPAGEKLSSVSDIMMGQQPGANVPATTSLATIEQSMKMFTAIYKRIHRSLSSEYKKMRYLNKLYLEDEEYYTVTDDKLSVTREDYEDKDCDVIPASDPNNATDVMRIFKAQSLIDMLGKGLDDDEIKRRYLEAMHIEDIDKLIPKQQEPQPDPMLELEIAKLDIEKQKLAIEQQKLELEQKKTEAEIVKIKADSLKALAEVNTKENQMLQDKDFKNLEMLEKEINIGASLNATENSERNVGKLDNQQNNASNPE